MPSFCEDLSHIAKYRNRNSPPADASARGCRGKIAVGNNGSEYMSVKRKDGIYVWKKVQTGKRIRVSVSPRRRRRLPTSPAIIVRRSPSPRRRRSLVVSPLIFFARPRYIPYRVPRRSLRPSPRSGSYSPSERAAIARRAEKFIQDDKKIRNPSVLQRARDDARAADQQRADRRAAEILAGRR